MVEYVDGIAFDRCTGCDVMCRCDLMENKSRVVFWGKQLCPICTEDADQCAEANARECDPVEFQWFGGR